MIKLLSLNQSTCKNLSLSAFIKYSKPFHGIELRFKSIQKFLSENRSLKDLQELLEVYGLELTSIFSLKNFSLCSENEYKTKIIPKFNQMINYCAKLEGNLILVSPSYLESAAEVETIPKWRIYRKTTKRLTHLSKLANNEELRLGFEFKTIPKSS